MSDIIVRRAMIVLAVIGFAIANYLTYVHYFGLPLVCGAGGHGCAIVQGSKYSEIAGLPVVLPGVLGYGVLLVLLTLRRFQDETGRLLTVVVCGIGFAFSVYLTYIGLVVIGHSCIWCLSSATVMTLLFIAASVRWVNAPTVKV